MPGRKYSIANTNYRYGFNGKELDKETSSTTTYDYGFRIYSPALGRFLSVDPLTRTYPYYTPYQFAGNTPIQAIDLDGLEEYVIVKELYKNSKTKSITIQFTKDKAKNNVNVHFREVLGKNTDGTERLGDYLTGNKVLRIVRDANGHETLGNQSDNLTKEELSVVAKHTTNDLPENPTQDAWNISIGKNIYTSETARNTSLMTDKIAEQNFPIIKNNELNQKFSGSTVFLGTTAILPGSGNYKNGQINWLDNDSKRMKSLISRIKEGGDIKSISITVNLNINNATDADFKNFEAGVEYFGKQLKDAFSKSGVNPSKINIQTNVLRDKPNADLGTKVVLAR